MRRAKTLTGLLLQTLQLRWKAIGSRGRTLAIVGLVLAGAVALHLGTCLLGGCPSSASPCGSPCSGATSDEPCPFSAERAPAGADTAADSTAADSTAADSTAAAAVDEPPCHAE